MPKVNYLNSFDKSNVCLLVCTYMALFKIQEDGFAGIECDKQMQMIGQAAEQIKQAYTELIKSVSDKQQHEIERYALSHDMVVEEKWHCTQAKKQSEIFIADKDDILEVCKHAKDFECLFCDKDSAHAKNCKLKGALNRIGVDKTGNDKDCPFRNKID